MKSQINILKLVYPPITNQEAEWLKEDKEVAEEIKSSNLYMIVQRHESKFEICDDENSFDKFTQDLKIKFKYIIDKEIEYGEIDFKELVNNANIKFEDYDYELELGEKQIRIWKKEHLTQKKDILDWFTTEKILWDKWRGHPAIKGLEDYKKFTNYYLHYIGISNEDDSLTRLVIKPHDKRLRVLSNENTKSKSSRLTDEIIFLFFKIEKFEIQTYEDDSDIDSFINGLQIDYKKIIADAEKAFINILDSKYNKVKYKNYPKGIDGLYNEKLDGYCYIIGESLNIITDNNQIRGEFLCHKNGFYNNTDGIYIKNDNVTLLKYDKNLKD